MANALAELVESIHRVFPGSRMERATEEQLAAVRRHHPDAPLHYREFLERVGWGALGQTFMVYSGLVRPEEIFDPPTAAELSGLLFLGDDFAGWVVAFDTHARWRLVGVENGSVPEPLEQHSLAEFIAQLVADARNPEPGAAAGGGA